MRTLRQILQDANSYLDFTTDNPVGDELDIRIRFAQMAVREWENAYLWKQLKITNTTQATLATISLGTNFKELLSEPVDCNDEFYPEINPEERHYKDLSDRYSYVTGNDVDGYILTFNNLASFATVSIDYQRHASSMATLTDICEVPDDLYVVKRTISYVLEAREDGRYQSVMTEAQALLNNMIGREQIQRPGGENRTRRIGAAAYRIGT